MGSSRREMRYRLGLDLGTGSAGSAIVEINDERRPQKLVRLGVRVFPDGRDAPRKEGALGEPLGATRTAARQQRRRLDRTKARRKKTILALSKWGLFPTDPLGSGHSEAQRLEGLDPWALRVAGLDNRLEPHEFGRALFHLQQRRGFQSNRRSVRTDKQDEQKVRAQKKAIQNTEDGLATARTYAELVTRSASNRSTRDHRAPVRSKNCGSKNRPDHEYYPTRAMIRNEFEILWESQTRFHPQLLTEDAKAAIRDAIFFQRPLKRQTPGWCPLIEGERRAPAAVPSFQAFRLLQEVNHLRIRHSNDLADRPLTRIERDQALEFLRTHPKDGLKEMRLAVLGDEARQVRFTKEVDSNRTVHDSVWKAVIDWGALGSRWREMPLDERDQFIEAVLELQRHADPSHDDLDNLKTRWSLSAVEAKRLVQIDLPSGYARYSAPALRRLAQVLEDEWIEIEDRPMRVDEALRFCGYIDDDLAWVRRYDYLPPYAEVLRARVVPVAAHAGHTEPWCTINGISDPDCVYGRIANPSVHIALNELRKVVNDTIHEYGLPGEITIELARDLKSSRREREQWIKQRDERTEMRTKRWTEIEEIIPGLLKTRVTDLKAQLWYELGVPQQCVYCGRNVSLREALGDDGAVEADHVLPRSRTFDDNPANRVLACQGCNKDKLGRSPYEAFGHDEDRWGDILRRVRELSDRNDDGGQAWRRREWRFSESAMERFEEESDLHARHLHATRYMSVVAREYLSAVCDPRRIRTTSGRLTALLRHEWGLDGTLGVEGVKNRDDHRHHAIDALVIALTDERAIHSLNNAWRAGEAGGAQRVAGRIEPPIKNIVEDARRTVRRVIASHRPDHSIGGGFFRDTAYAILCGKSMGEHPKHICTCSRRDFGILCSDLGPGEYLTWPMHQGKSDTAPGKKTPGASPAKCRICGSPDPSHGSKRTPNSKPLPKSLVPIRNDRDPSGLPLKGYELGEDAYHAIEIYRDETLGSIGSQAITRFEANSSKFKTFIQDSVHSRRYAFACDRSAEGVSKSHLLMRLHKGDCLVIEETEGKRDVMRVQQFAAHVNGMQVILVGVNEANAAKRLSRTSKNPVPRVLKVMAHQLPTVKYRARQVFVTPLGNLHDPGFRP